MTKYNLLLIICCLFFSCEDFLDETPKSEKTTIGTSLLDAQESVNGIYAYLRAPYNRTGYAKMVYSILEVSTGALKPAVGTQDTDMEDAYALIYSSSNANASGFWNTYYGGVEAANIAIASIPTITDPELTTEKANALLGEAYFLRAYYYYQLVQIFGDIPLNITPSSSFDDGLLPKSSVQEVYETVIVPDLLIAEDAGLPNTSSSGRVTKGAVKSLLAKVYLTMAGAPLNQTDKYALARDKANEVISAEWYNLFQSDGSKTWFNKLNNPAFDNTEENIFMVQYNDEAVGSSITSYFTPIGGEAISPLTLHFGGMEPEEDYISSYDANDLRAQNQGFFFNEMDGVTFNNSVYKYFYEEYREGNGLSGKNVPLLRYADVLLTYAEAHNEVATADASAYNALNAIRSRAGLADVSGLSKEDFREEVWKQRFWEFAAEAGIIWFDQRRTGMVFNGSDFGSLVGSTLPNGKTLTEDNVYFPIPQNEVVLNPNLGD
ncbi:RagB/SusD family nutrient uptake outer membrane protein [Maribacter luteus]|uniref:RagB/SusD family nutrient uptake outer membrane protein n=1 Tax=Maribacter luteus TaxID=2594478 RepID=A0A6I2MH01_9FLAO|nr:RagB/SusD family nutrient uptake outer membrane protein [Maribacter luteus]MRX63141.1 RagB/SusD family nutrient uptake outer membrane protein [Maribacter luteus]